MRGAGVPVKGEGETRCPPPAGEYARRPSPRGRGKRISAINQGLVKCRFGHAACALLDLENGPVVYWARHSADGNVSPIAAGSGV